MSVPRPDYNVCVFCGSNGGLRPDYVAAARALGEALAHRGMGLVYGGASIGVMGAVADACLEAGGHVEGVIPGGLFAREVAHTRLSQLHVVESMHARKALMASLSDAFVALPGGFGTFEELFEVVTWGQLGIHRKPIALLNTGGYYDSLLRFLDHAVQEGFISLEHRGRLLVKDRIDALIDTVLAYIPPPAVRWIAPEET
jgi:hypothetical protein